MALQKQYQEQRKFEQHRLKLGDWQTLRSLPNPWQPEGFLSSPLENYTCKILVSGTPRSWQNKGGGTGLQQRIKDNLLTGDWEILSALPLLPYKASTQARMYLPLNLRSSRLEGYSVEK